MGRVVGIDLGTTNTAVAVLLDGKPKVLEDERGYKVLPSCISAKGDGRFIVGHAAHNLILTRPGRTVYAAKRLIGRRFDSPEVEAARKHMQYQIREAPDGGVQVQVGDAWMSPTEIAAIILQVVKSIAERSLGEPLEGCIITVPAYFNHAQRQATMEAAQLAGMRCERLLNEPTAAALAYGFKKTMDRTVLVFDLGGGTFDVSVLKIGDGLYETLATVGDTYLGGEDFDFRIVEHFAEHFQKKTGIDLRADKHTLQRLKDAAERAKCELSFAERTVVSVPHVTPTDNLELTLSRATIESATADLVQRCVEVTRKAVSEAGLSLKDIDEVILVGGQSRMPRLREAVTSLFGKDPSRAVHPEEAVAVGAAIHASSLEDPDTPGAILLDVTPFDLGIDSAGGMFTPVVQRNARVPCSETRTFVTARDGQDSVKIVVRQGGSRTASDNEFLGEFLMTGLTAAPRFQTKVDVTFRLDNNGILHVSAVEKGTGERKQIVIRNYADRAKEPRMPSPEEAALDRDRRAKAEAESTAAAPVATPAASAGTKKKVGFFDALFGARKPKAASPTPVAAPVAAIPEAPELPQIDLSQINLPKLNVSEVEAEEIQEITDLPEETPPTGPASLGLAGEGPHDIPAPPKAPEKAPEVEKPAKIGFTPPNAPIGFDSPPAPEGPIGFDQPTASSGGFEGFDIPVEDENPFASEGVLSEAELFGTVGDLDAALDAAFLGLGGDTTPAPAQPFGGVAAPAILASDDSFDTIAAPALMPENSDDALAEAERLAKELEEGWGEPDDLPFYLPPPAVKGEPKGEPKPKGEVSKPVITTPSLGSAYPDEDEETPEAPLAKGGTQSLQPEAETRPPSDLDDLPADMPLSSPLPAEAARKPARIKLNYRRFEVFVSEYRENMRKGGTFIKTDKPLTPGRMCVFEVKVPGVPEPVLFDAVVSWVQDGSVGDRGMGVEYRMDERQRYQIERLLKGV